MRKPRPAGDNSIGRLVRAARTERGLSQMKLAQLTGYSRGWIAFLENAVQQPNISADLAQRLHTILGIPLEALAAPNHTIDLLPRTDLDGLSAELQTFVELALQLNASSEEIRVLQAVLRAIHVSKDRNSRRGADPMTEPNAPPDDQDSTPRV